MTHAAQEVDRIGQARQMYRRVLAGWAQDVLLIRARGLEQPGWPRKSPIVGEYVAPARGGREPRQTPEAA